MCPQRFYPASQSINDLRREMNRLMDGVMRPVGGMPAVFRTSTFPALNMWEDGESLYAEAEVPGLSMSDIELNLTGNELTIKGERKPLEGEDLAFHRRERGTGVFSRTVNLPVEVNADKVEATLKNGVLMVVLPKAEAARPRRITVQGE